MANSIKTNNYRADNISKLNKEECCGCGVCKYMCPTGAIEMQTDSEGFTYPTVDNMLCINCGKCLDKCTAANKENFHEANLSKAYYAYNSEEEELKKSASGGVAGGLSYAFVKKNGFVTGVGYSDDFREVTFSLVNSEGDVEKFFGSKYVKADCFEIFPEIRGTLEVNSPVLMIGLPCEVAALKRYLGKEYDNLYTCELICHGPTSTKVLEKCVDEIEKQYKSKIVDFSCRVKKPYWKPFYLNAKLENGEEYSKIFAESDMGKAFQIMKRPSCNNCEFKAPRTYADMTIGDFHGAKKQSPEYNEYGVSVCFVHTQKGEELMHMLEGFEIGKANICRAKGNYALFHPVEKIFGRKSFVKSLEIKTLKKAVMLPQVKLGLKIRIIKKNIKSLKKKVLSITK